MPNQYGSVAGYGYTGNVEDRMNAVQEAAGITQFRSDVGWYQIINGLFIQGGRVHTLANSTTTFPFEIGIPQQILGIWVQPILAGVGNGYGSIDPATTNLNQFTLVNTGLEKDYYWWAVGV